jgi:hypothetical protein
MGTLVVRKHLYYQDSVLEALWKKETNVRGKNRGKLKNAVFVGAVQKFEENALSFPSIKDVRPAGGGHGGPPHKKRA